MTTVRKLWPFGWVREIPRDGLRYLTRWSLFRQWSDEQSHRNGGGRVYLHRFWAPDVELHNHPWHWSLSIVLWGSYTETYFDKCTGSGSDEAAYEPDGGCECTPTQTRLVRWFNWIPRTRFHQITEIHPRFGIGPITLFISGAVHGDSWGFWVPGRGLVAHLKRKQERAVGSALAEAARFVDRRVT
jgi:hypothetical protein